MKPQTVSLTGDGATTTNTSPVRVNWRSRITSLSFDTDGSTTGFTAQYTMTPPDGYASGSAWATAATWHNSSIATATADEAGTIDGPVQGVRLQANTSGTDTGTLIITQYP